MKPLRSIPTSIPQRARFVQESDQQCECCWLVVKGKDYDFANNLCSECSKALVHNERRET